MTRRNIQLGRIRGLITTQAMSMPSTAGAGWFTGVSSFRLVSGMAHCVKHDWSSLDLIFLSALVVSSYVHQTCFKWSHNACLGCAPYSIGGWAGGVGWDDARCFERNNTDNRRAP